MQIPEQPARADKSGLEMHYATFGYASLWLMQRGGGRDKSAPTDVLLQPLDFWLNRLFEMYCPLRHL